MKTVFKYQIPTGSSTFYLQLPIEARFLKCAWRDQLGADMWFLVDSEYVYESRGFAVLSTGDPITNGYHTYVDTYFERVNFTDASEYVWHLFEINAKEKQ